MTSEKKGDGVNYVLKSFFLGTHLLQTGRVELRLIYDLYGHLQNNKEQVLWWLKRVH